MTGGRQDRYALQDRISAAWTNFARTGNPNVKSLLPEWPVFDTGRRATMVLDNECKVVNDPNGEERRALMAVRKSGGADNVRLNAKLWRSTSSSSAVVPRDCPWRFASPSCNRKKVGSRWRLPSSRKRVTPARTSCPAAVLDPSALRDLIPDFKEKGAPIAAEVHDEDVLFLTPSSKFALPIIPPPLKNHGNYIISLNQFVRWLTTQVEAAGIDFFTGFAGQDVLMDGARVIGVRTGDRGIGRHGEQKATFEPGVDILAKVTVFCDGVRGNLTKELLRRLELGDKDHPPQFAIGLKELWEIPRDRLKPGTVIHTLGVSAEARGVRRRVHLRDARRAASLGFVVGLDYRIRSSTRTWRSTASSSIRCVEAARRRSDDRYGAKALPEGGWNTIPRVYMDGG
jgi:hypothetical protein